MAMPRGWKPSRWKSVSTQSPTGSAVSCGQHEEVSGGAGTRPKGRASAHQRAHPGISNEEHVAIEGEGARLRETVRDDGVGAAAVEPEPLHTRGGRLRTVRV